MSHLVPSHRLPVILGLVLAGIFTSAPAWAKGSLASFNGKGTGYFIISQNGAFAASGSVNPAVKASAKKAKFVLACQIGNPAVKATQTITLKHGRAQLDHLLPGYSGFETSASGTYKLVGGKVRATLPFSNSNGGGTVYIEIEKTSFGTVLRVSTQITFRNGSNPIFMTTFAT
jgi:hypothetical protein